MILIDISKELVLYYSVIVLINDLKYYDHIFRNELPTRDKFFLIRQFIISISNVRGIIKSVKNSIAHTKEMTYLRKEIESKIDFFIFLRNKTCAHIDREIVENAIADNLFLYRRVKKNINPDNYHFILSKDLLESAIELYVRSNPNHKIIERSYDLMIHDHILLGIMEEFINDVFKYLDYGIKVLSENLEGIQFENEHSKAYDKLMAIMLPHK